MTGKCFYVVLLVCLSVILLFALRQAFYTSDILPHSLATLTLVSQLSSHASANLPHSSTSEASSLQSAFRTTAESLYVMYGERTLPDVDEHLFNYIRSMISRQGPGGRNLSSSPSRVDFSQFGGSKLVDKLLNQRRNGFFVECGAYNGEEYSDTLFFEIERNWTGILIEPNPEYHRSILKKNRNSLVLRSCLSHTGHPMLAKFRLDGWGSGVSELNKNVKQKNKNVTETDVQCFSLNSIMAAIGVHHIDFMVLDVEGSEIPVLETIDWRKLSVDVFSIEYSVHLKSQEKLDKIRQFFNKTVVSYKEVGRLEVQDVVFMRT